jgi:hypothetical protein
MAGDIIIIFTNHHFMCSGNEDIGEEIFKNLGVSDYGSDLCRYLSVGFGQKSCCFGRTGILQVKDGVDLLIASDTEPDVRMKEVLRTFINGCDKVFVVYHDNPIEPNIKKLQQEFLYSLTQELKKPYAFIFQSHIRGHVYCDELIQIADSITKKDPDGYKKAKERILSRFGDLLLEAKLELLHLCLTPEGAKDLANQATKGNPPDHSLSASDKFWDKKLVQQNNTLPQKYPNKPYIFNTDGEKEKHKEWSVSDLVHALAKQPNGEKKVDYKDNDCFDQEYLTALSALRDVLLPDNHSSE